MLELLLIIAAIFCAYQVMRSERLLMSTIWLALTSALVALLLYRLGAYEVAVIELSVGAGLVTVLFVFAFSITGEDTLDRVTVVPRPLVWGLVLASSVLLGWLTFPYAQVMGATAEASFAGILWDQRGLDVFAQVMLIFGGVIGLMGLLTESHKTTAAEIESQLEQSVLELEPANLIIDIPSGALAAEPENFEPTAAEKENP